MSCLCTCLHTVSSIIIPVPVLPCPRLSLPLCVHCLSLFLMFWSLSPQYFLPLLLVQSVNGSVLVFISSAHPFTKSCPPHLPYTRPAHVKNQALPLRVKWTWMWISYGRGATLLNGSIIQILVGISTVHYYFTTTSTLFTKLLSRNYHHSFTFTRRFLNCSW